MKIYKNTICNKILRKTYFSSFLKWPKTVLYNSFIKNRVIDRIRRKKVGPYRVVFFVLNGGMWKFESLFELMLKDSRFEPVIIPYSQPWQSKVQQKSFQTEVIDYCKRKKFPYLIGYDIETCAYIPANKLKADFVSFSQPYNNWHDFWRLENFLGSSLIFSYPYGLPLEQPVFNNLLLHNVAWKNFFPNDALKHLYDANPVTKGRNYIITGNVTYDRMSKVMPFDEWRDRMQNKKRIIWAPHHTIGDIDTLPFSTFLLIADDMLKIAQEYADRAEFAFKPHPMLKERLYDVWGEERTEQYYRQWEDMPNTILVLGDYVPLFQSSDAMIHDCSGFMMEYLYTKMPVMFVNKGDTRQYLSSFASKCFDIHYQGSNVEEIRGFIENVVIGGKDIMADQRSEFYNTELLPPNNKSAAQNMLDNFLSVIS